MATFYICVYCAYIFPKNKLKITGVKIKPKKFCPISSRSVKWHKFEEIWTIQKPFLVL